jgi:hypothetical protein
MLQRLPFFILFLLSFAAGHSQTIVQKEKILSEKSIDDNSIDSVSFDTNRSTQIRKSDYPDSQKVSPEIFYIVNDKPVSKEEYLNHRNKR